MCRYGGLPENGKLITLEIRIFLLCVKIKTDVSPKHCLIIIYKNINYVEKL